MASSLDWLQKGKVKRFHNQRVKETKLPDLKVKHNTVLRWFYEVSKDYVTSKQYSDKCDQLGIMMCPDIEYKNNAHLN